MKRLLSLILALSMIFVLASCSNSATTGTTAAAVGSGLKAKSGTFTVAYAAVTTSLAPWTVALANSFQAQCDANGWKATIYDGMGDPQKQASQIDTIITMADTVDLCLIFPTDPNSAATYAQKLKAAGIAVVMLNSDVPKESQQYVSAYVGPDNAKMSGELAKFVETKKGADTALNYVVISGVPVQQDYIEREAGLAAEIKNTKYTQLGATQYALSDRSKAKSFMENFITQYPNIDILFGLSDDLTLGGIQAIADAGLTDKITVVSIDGMKEAFAAIKAGTLDMSIQNPAKDFMAKFAEVTGKLIKGESVEYYSFTNYYIVTKDNVDTFTAEY